MSKDNRPFSIDTTCLYISFPTEINIDAFVSTIKSNFGSEIKVDAKNKGGHGLIIINCYTPIAAQNVTQNLPNLFPIFAGKIEYKKVYAQKKEKNEQEQKQKNERKEKKRSTTTKEWTKK